MWYLKTRSLFVACGMSVVLLAAPAESKALFEWLCPANWCKPAPDALTYAPPYSAQRIAWQPVSPAASACNPCASGSMSLVPQTSYRWSYSRVERTTYRPVTTFDPCSGCPRTAYQPVTTKTLLPWLHRKSYTTSRAVYSLPYAASYSGYGSPCGAGPCGPAACNPCGQNGSVWGSSLSSCPSGACGQASYQTVVPSYNGSGSRIDSGSSGPPSTYKQDTQQPDLRLRPAPDSNTGPAPMSVPAAIGPDSRTAVRPVRQTVLYHPVSWSPAPGSPAKPPLDVSGWRASHD